MRRLSACLLSLVLCPPLSAPVHAQANGAEEASANAEIEKFEAMMAFVRKRNERDYTVASLNGIDEAEFVEVGGIEQWITIRGEDRSNPVLLFLHGGPGDATNPWGYAGFRSWLKHFTVVQWDQRGAGRTLGKNGSSLAPTITLERMAQDGVELAELLRKSLEKDKIVLVGHSFGSILGVFMAKARPDLFYAFVGTGQVADPARSYSVAYGELLRKAEALGDEHAIRELQEVGPPPYPDGQGYAVQRRWSNLFEGADFFISSMLAFALGAPGYTLGDVNEWIDGQSLSAERLVPQTSALDARALRGDFRLPVFVIQGAEDFTTPAALAERFVSSIRAPRKEFVSIEGGGHFAVFMKSGAFLKELVPRVLPLVNAGEDLSGLPVRAAVPPRGPQVDESMLVKRAVRQGELMPDITLAPVKPPVSVADLERLDIRVHPERRGRSHVFEARPPASRLRRPQPHDSGRDEGGADRRSRDRGQASALRGEPSAEADGGRSFRGHVARSRIRRWDHTRARRAREAGS